MKLLNTLGLLVLLQFSTGANAADSKSPLCNILRSEKHVKEIYSKSIMKGKVSKFNKYEAALSMKVLLNGDLNYDRHGRKIKRWSQVVDLFSAGSDELNLTMYLVRFGKNNIAKVYYINSYPGDNEYGAWITTNGKIFAEVQDGDLVVANKWCPYID